MRQQSNDPAKFEFFNRQAGDVAVCGTFTEPHAILAGAAGDRVCFVAPLDCRSDLEHLLRGLLLHFNVGHLVLCGDDLKAIGEALLALWREGLGENGQVPGSRGLLSPELDAGVVNGLRQSIRVYDWRGEPISEVAKGILALPRLPQGRGPVVRDVAPMSERKIFPSRRTTFPIFSTDVPDAWLQLLNLVLRIGMEKKTADGARIAEALNAVVTIAPATVEDEFPKFVDFNRDDFERYYRRYKLSPAFDGLQASPEACSSSVVFTAPELVGPPDAGSGLLSATYNVVDRKLVGSFVLRSADVYTDWPLEAMALVRLQRELAERRGLAAGSAVFVIHAAHLSDRDWERASRLLAEWFKRPLPLQIDPAGIFLFGNDGGQARAMLLDSDASTIFWEEAFSDPEDLSWYIVDVMPWLLPQHVRYVGQECAALMRAIRTGEPYEQG